MTNETGDLIPVSFNVLLGHEQLTALDRMLQPLRHSFAQRAAERPFGSPDLAIALQSARKALRLSARRERILGKNFNADPAWHILLDLLIRETDGLKTSVSSACQASFAPPTTALRHLAILEEMGLIVRKPSSTDNRRIFVELTDQGEKSLIHILGSE